MINLFFKLLWPSRVKPLKLFILNRMLRWVISRSRISWFYGQKPRAEDLTRTCTHARLGPALSHAHVPRYGRASHSLPSSIPSGVVPNVRGIPQIAASAPTGLWCTHVCPIRRSCFALPPKQHSICGCPLPVTGTGGCVASDPNPLRHPLLPASRASHVCPPVRHPPTPFPEALSPRPCHFGWEMGRFRNWLLVMTWRKTWNDLT